MALTNATDKPLIALTMGDPAGVGPELCLCAVAHEEVLAVCRPVIVGDASVLGEVSARLGIPMPAHIETLGDTTLPTTFPTPAVFDRAQIADPGAFEPGRATALGGRASHDYVVWTVEQTRLGHFDAMTTAPITKAAWRLAGFDDPGHTELLGRLTDADDFAMMLYSDRLAVSLVTCHRALASVPDALRADDVVRVARLTRETLRRIRRCEPRLAVCGLNPHAGEGGLFGREEIETIAPAVERCRAEGMNIEGPIPPDAAFMPHALEHFDGHVVMYHDQGLIPFKMISLHDGVNVTMGLPIVRTSPDHGTAYDIAWTGRAKASSTISALRLAARLTQQ